MRHIINPYIAEDFANSYFNQVKQTNPYLANALMYDKLMIEILEDKIEELESTCKHLHKRIKKLEKRLNK